MTTMKNASKHADELKQLTKRLGREPAPPERQTLEPLDALVRGAMSYDVSDSRADDAMKAIGKEFVGLNELRVATDLEIQELLGQKYPLIEQRVAMITQSLNDIFEREHTLSLDRLKNVSRRETRQFLRELPGINAYTEAYVMLFAFDGHAIPVDEPILEMLRNYEIIDEQTSAEESQRFLEHHTKTEEAYDFYARIRRASHGDLAKKKARS